MPWGQSEGANVRLQPKPWDFQRDQNNNNSVPIKSFKSVQWCLVCSQNKWLSKYQRRASQLSYRTLTAWRQRGRCVTARAIRQGAASISTPEAAYYTKLSRLPVVNHIFLGLWTVHICQECHSLRSVPQRRHVANLSCALTAYLGN